MIKKHALVEQFTLDKEKDLAEFDRAGKLVGRTFDCDNGYMFFYWDMIAGQPALGIAIRTPGFKGCFPCDASVSEALWTQYRNELENGEFGPWEAADYSWVKRHPEPAEMPVAAEFAGTAGLLDEESQVS